MPKESILSHLHRDAGAQFVEFAGWEMPLKFSSVAEEHMAVRESAGLFDVSHMGELIIRGPNASDFLQKLTTNDISKLVVGRAQYSTVLNERGGTKDDVVIYKQGEQRFMLVCNAANVGKLKGWFRQHLEKGVEVEDITSTTVLLALQGPRAYEILQQLTSLNLGQLRRFGGAWIEVTGLRVWVGRTGYTGEDGFELYLTGVSPSDPTNAEKLWKSILEAGARAGLKPCGLGARNTTRLEAGFCLYGNELTEEITPLEARLDFVVKFEKNDFIGREPLLEQRRAGLKRIRVGLRMSEAGIPREGYGIFRDGEKIGSVSSGTFSPLLRMGIAMGYTIPDVKLGDRVLVEIHGNRKEAEIVAWPFYDTTRYGYARRSGA
jgi:aminomethyltransferase